MSKKIRLNKLIPDIIIKINDNLEFISQINLRLVSKFFKICQVTNLIGCYNHYRFNLTNDILKSYPYIIKLDINNYEKITKLHYLRHLQELNASFNCGIT